MDETNMTKCPVCNADISKTAKVCPHCGAEVKKKKKPIWLYIVLAVVVIAVVGSMLSGGNKNDPKPEDPTKQEQQAPTKFKVGEKAELNNVTVTLLGVTENKGSTFNTPAEGNVFVLCEFEMENNTTGDVVVSSMLSFEAYCDGYTTNFSLAALVEKGSSNQLDGTVAAGKKFKGVIGYELPASWKELEIKFTPDVWTGHDITFVATH